MPRSELATVHDGREIDAHHLVEICQVIVEEAMVEPAGNGGIIHHRIECAEFRQGEVDQRLDVFPARYVGAPEANRALSEQRAKAVVAYITSRFGVDGSRLQAVGMGEQDLAVPTPAQTPEPRNRRVLVVNLGA